MPLALAKMVKAAFPVRKRFAALLTPSGGDALTRISPPFATSAE
jgi:hypothetical protein